MLIICNGMLRSGSTLQYNIVTGVFGTVSAVKRAGFLGDFADPAVRTKLDAMKAAGGVSVVKTHEPALDSAFYDSRVRVLFSYRDVRDIAASIRKKWRYPFEKILADIETMLAIQRNFESIPNVFFQSYDKLYNDLPGAIADIAAFLEVPLTSEDCSRIADENSIGSQIDSRSKRTPIPKRIGSILRRRTYDPRTLLHSDHISATNGKDGDWLNQFSDEEISFMNIRFGRWLAEYGYTADGTSK